MPIKNESRTHRSWRLYREPAEASQPGDERRTIFTEKPSPGLVGSTSYYARVVFGVPGVRHVVIVEHFSERRVTIQVEGGEQWAISRAIMDASKLAGVIFELEWTK